MTSSRRRALAAVLSLGLAVLVVGATARLPQRSLNGDLIFIASDAWAPLYPVVGAVILSVAGGVAALRWRFLGWVSLFCVGLFAGSSAYLLWVYSLARAPF